MPVAILFDLKVIKSVLVRDFTNFDDALQFLDYYDIFWHYSQNLDSLLVLHAVEKLWIFVQFNNRCKQWVQRKNI